MCTPAAPRNPKGAMKFVDRVLDPDVSLDTVQTTANARTNSGARELAEPKVKELLKDLDEWDEAEGFEFVGNLGPGVEP